MRTIIRPLCTQAVRWGVLTFLALGASHAATTTIGLFTGADPGEGLDFTGDIRYAIDTGPLGGNLGQIGDANFTDESAEGVTLVSGQKAGGWNADIFYGDSPGDALLGEFMSSISWSDAAAAVSTVQLTLTNLEVGAAYKLQLLFAEQQWPRGFDVSVDGVLVANDFSPAFYQSGSVFPLILPSPDDKGVVLTHSFIARTTAVQVLLDGKGTTNSEFTDHNALINAATLELVARNVDSDSDGLPDPWEIEAFSNLAQTGTGDPDQDGLTNAQEFAKNTDPNKKDTDGDGLSDGDEVNTYKSDPLKVDSDGDGLSDNAEIATYKTDPSKADTDGDRLDDGSEINVTKTDPSKADTDADGVSDFDELRVMTDPLKKESVSKTTSVGVITGGDPGEGLDLQGKFIYAFSVGTENPAGQVGDANFTGETVDGVLIEQAPSLIENWYIANFGETSADVGIAAAIASIRHGGGGAKITLNNLVVGAAYKLQLMFGEACCARGLDLQIDGRQVVDEFAPFIYQGGLNNQSPATNHAAVITHTFVANKTSVEILTVGGTVTTPGYTDRNPILNAVTLEETLPVSDTDSDGL
ncbi:MAG TPA: binary toxin-like calcium binding domain-containing protein, partial [Verrucomicrobiae bacterium]|nr:binary toxin-like calcium binding domain-containing protein [Verrucomicrobiae bacterium]